MSLNLRVLYYPRDSLFCCPPTDTGSCLIFPLVVYIDQCYIDIDYDESYDLHFVSCIFELNIQPCVYHHAVSVVLCFVFMLFTRFNKTKKKNRS